MSIHPGAIETVPDQFEVIAATSFLDMQGIADPTPIIDRNPDLFLGAWEGDTEVVALLHEGEVAAAGVLRYGVTPKKSLEVYAVGEGQDLEVLRDALSERIDGLRQELTPDGGVPLHKTVHWGAKPPTVETKPDDPKMGVKGFLAAVALRRQQVQDFMDDLHTTYGGLKV